jgi:hypothetical protein
MALPSSMTAAEARESVALSSHLYLEGKPEVQEFVTSLLASIFDERPRDLSLFIQDAVRGHTFGHVPAPLANVADVHVVCSTRAIEMFSHGLSSNYLWTLPTFLQSLQHGMEHFPASLDVNATTGSYQHHSSHISSSNPLVLGLAAGGVTSRFLSDVSAGMLQELLQSLVLLQLPILAISPDDLCHSANSWCSAIESLTNIPLLLLSNIDVTWPLQVEPQHAPLFPSSEQWHYLQPHASTYPSKSICLVDKRNRALFTLLNWISIDTLAVSRQAAAGIRYPGELSPSEMLRMCISRVLVQLNGRDSMERKYAQRYCLVVVQGSPIRCEEVAAEIRAWFTEHDANFVSHANNLIVLPIYTEGFDDEKQAARIQAQEAALNLLSLSYGGSTEVQPTLVQVPWSGCNIPDGKRDVAKETVRRWRGGTPVLEQLVLEAFPLTHPEMDLETHLAQSMVKEGEVWLTWDDHQELPTVPVTIPCWSVMEAFEMTPQPPSEEEEKEKEKESRSQSQRSGGVEHAMDMSESVDPPQGHEQGKKKKNKKKAAASLYSRPRLGSTLCFHLSDDDQDGVINAVTRRLVDVMLYQATVEDAQLVRLAKEKQLPTLLTELLGGPLLPAPMVQRYAAFLTAAHFPVPSLQAAAQSLLSCDSKTSHVPQQQTALLQALSQLVLAFNVRNRAWRVCRQWQHAADMAGVLKSLLRVEESGWQACALPSCTAWLEPLAWLEPAVEGGDGWSSWRNPAFICSRSTALSNLWAAGVLHAQHAALRQAVGPVLASYPATCSQPVESLRIVSVLTPDAFNIARRQEHVLTRRDICLMGAAPVDPLQIAILSYDELLQFLVQPLAARFSRDMLFHSPPYFPGFPALSGIGLSFHVDQPAELSFLFDPFQPEVAPMERDVSFVVISHQSAIDGTDIQSYLLDRGRWQPWEDGRVSPVHRVLDYLERNLHERMEGGNSLPVYAADQWRYPHVQFQGHELHETPLGQLYPASALQALPILEGAHGIEVAMEKSICVWDIRDREKEEKEKEKEKEEEEGEGESVTSELDGEAQPPT